MTAEEPELREPDLPRTMKVRQRALRTGWTTGACASAAAKAATALLRTGEPADHVQIALPSGNRVTFKVEDSALEGERARAVVVKDAGDDPDVTHGAHITARVSWSDTPGIELDGGEGVGVVTKPGLGLEPGGPAINPVPRRMITHAVAEALLGDDLDAAPEDAGAPADPESGRGVRVVISVPDGERMARKTTNKRLGILGGISILGTTGIVRPFSTASWRASVEQAVSVMAAQGESTLVLCTGGRTEKGAMKMLPKLPDVCFVEVGDFTGAALRRAVEHGLRQVVFVGMAGKLTKLASGILMTHYTRSRVSTELLGEITTDMGGTPELAAEVAVANTARHAYELWERAGLLGPCGRELCRRVAGVLERFCAEEAGGELAAQVVLVDFTGERMVGMYGRLAR
ncbi:cobalt-precorrin-5B (C(1))-methyltransferase [Thermomonospora umbrina]|uniref:Cobalt-precorrin-5B C(1)-methyltransferase n=1 Tax=Thermomonospora umbrina TaxID=111806 RepID=A0A3D9SRY6_9ACTN|nr:cobalt-precorrin-5B (C(1))-methyltransferase [Thermomonospora umbrina]REE95725.1 cobalt-precorrin-5B (C1)-methyltransferase [Thermomonospora umbrina]